MLRAVWIVTATSGTAIRDFLEGSQQFLERLRCTVALPFRFAVTVLRTSPADEVTPSAIDAGVYAGPGSSKPFSKDRTLLTIGFARHGGAWPPCIAKNPKLASTSVLAVLGLSSSSKSATPRQPWSIASRRSDGA